MAVKTLVAGALMVMVRWMVILFFVVYLKRDQRGIEVGLFVAAELVLRGSQNHHARYDRTRVLESEVKYSISK